jgi:peptide/nickel transport system substrate-binding protein
MNEEEEKRKPWKQRIELKKHSRVIKKRARKVEGATVRHARRFIVNRWDKITEVRLRIIAWLGGVGLLIGLVGLQMIWFQQSYITRAAVEGGTYAEGVKGSINTLNPLYAATPAELSASHLIFSSLYTIDSTGVLNTDLAEKMTVDADKVFTVSMRKDARWHDGQPLTAKDVVFTVGLMKSPAVRSVMTGSWQDINAAVIDDYTVRFTLPASYAAFPQALTFAVLPEHLLKEVRQTALRESKFSSIPVGSGPFALRLLQVINQSEGRKIVHMDANSDYYDGRPRLDHFQLHTYADDDSIGQALRTGEIGAASGVASSVAHTVDSNRYTIDIRPVNSGVYALFNFNQPTLKDPAVRRALLVGTDTSAIRKQLYGNPQQLYLPFPTGQVKGTDEIDPPKFNKSEADKILTEAGWIKKDGVRTKGTDKLRLRVVTRQNSDYEAVLRMLVGQWRDLGVEVDSEAYTTSRFTEDVLQLRNYDVLLDELAIGADPDVFVYWHSRGLLNFTGYGNQLSDDTLASARTRSDTQLRALKYVSFARQWLADIPAIGLYQSNFIYVHSKSIEAIEDGEKIVSPSEHYANVEYWTAERGAVYKTP